jgi:hypothetical protein
MKDLNPFKDKRTDLEGFVREQIIGPGAFNKRYFLLKDWEQNEFYGQQLKAQHALDNVTEVIAEVPAYQYSSAILFPIAITADERRQISAQQIDDRILDEDEPDEGVVKADDEDFTDDQSESTSSKNQSYPNTCGLSFAVKSGSSLHHQVKVTITLRKYHKVKQAECQLRQLGIWLQQYPDEISLIVQAYFAELFEIITKDTERFICLKPGVNINEHLYRLDYVNLDKLLKERLLPLISAAFPEKELFKATQKVYDSVSYDYVALYEDSLMDELQKELSADANNFLKYQALIQQLEIHNQVKQLVNELKAIYRQSSSKNFPTPIWESMPFNVDVELPAFPDDLLVLRGEEPVKGIDELWLSFQYLRHVKGIFVKLILVNRSRIELGEDEPYQLNKKDQANELASFGVQIRVNELSPDTFLPYNPPNLLIIDEEDSFNKLLYRQFKDYAEGYNTSVSWGDQNNNSALRYVCTEFLPEQETPSVDYRPTAVLADEGRTIRLIDEDVLSMRALSTLSSKTDDEVLALLKSLVDAYGLWISGEREELNDPTSIEGIDLLKKQLAACTSDHARLIRNICLLRKDRAGLAAFRTMNTAMFMQLHHGRSVKQLKKGADEVFVPVANNASYYASLELKDDYRWRSFQLAFILLNIDAFIRPDANDHTVPDVFGTGWPERNELADLVWFPTGGGKTEAYLGIIAFTIAHRRFTKEPALSGGTTVLMRYTLRLLTLQQFQRATLLICALEVVRKENFPLHGHSLGRERISIGLFVGKGSLPNKWLDMHKELTKIADQLSTVKKGSIKTVLPHTECPWCGGSLFKDNTLRNVEPQELKEYGINDMFKIMCTTNGCTFYDRRPNAEDCLPFRLFDEDIYKFPPTLLFGTVDKFAALANKVSTETGGRNQDSRRLLGKGVNYRRLPPELIIQDELHLLLGPLGSAVGLFEKAIDELCGQDIEGIRVSPKVITSTATTRNTDKQIFALFGRRCEMFPKQGINCDDSFFSFYMRDEDDITKFSSNRKYIGLLPIGKTQVWMQLRMASVCLAHRVKYLIEHFEKEEVFLSAVNYQAYAAAFDYYHTVLSYFNSLKEVGKTQSQLSHYLPGDLNLVLKNTVPWTIFMRMIKPVAEIDSSELTGRLSGEEVKTNLSSIETKWRFNHLPAPPEFVIATNMISVGIDVSRFNTMIINSMPRNTAEYIQASSRVARDREGIVFTVHHPFRSRDISHYQKFREFHEKFYSYVEPISVTPFANKALDRYFAMYLTVILRHNATMELSDNDAAVRIDEAKVEQIKREVISYIQKIRDRADRLNNYLSTRESGVRSNVEGVIGQEEQEDILLQLTDLLNNRWLDRISGQDPLIDLKFRDKISSTSLFRPRNAPHLNGNWNVKESLREIDPSVVIKTVQQ